MKIIIYSINFYWEKNPTKQKLFLFNTKSGSFHYTEKKNKQTESLLFPMSLSLHTAFTKLKQPWKHANTAQTGRTCWMLGSKIKMLAWIVFPGLQSPQSSASSHYFNSVYVSFTSYSHKRTDHFRLEYSMWFHSQLGSF